jgi:hypothetical protein
MISTSKTVAIAKIQKQISAIQSIDHSEPYSEQFKAWRKESERALDNIFSNGSRQLNEFIKIPYRRSAVVESGSTYDQTPQLEAFKNGLEKQKLPLNHLSRRLKNIGQRIMLNQTAVPL